MKVLHLNCGTLGPRGGRWINGEGGLLGRARLVCHCLVVETRQGLVLVDTGLGLADVELRGWRHRSRLRSMGATLDPSETAVRQLMRLGYAPDDVRHVLLTHMDFDHAGGLADFPRAEVHLLLDEYEAAMRPLHWIERLRYLPATWSHQPRWVLHRPEGESWMGFDCVREIQGLPPELLLIPLRGHTRGHCGVAVDAGEGWLLHCGDAYFYAGEMIPHRPYCTPGLNALQSLTEVDRGARRQNQERLRELVRERGDSVRVFSAHDPSELQALRQEAGREAPSALRAP